MTPKNSMSSPAATFLRCYIGYLFYIPLILIPYLLGLSLVSKQMRMWLVDLFWIDFETLISFDLFAYSPRDLCHIAGFTIFLLFVLHLNQQMWGNLKHNFKRREEARLKLGRYENIAGLSLDKRVIDCSFFGTLCDLSLIHI